MFVAFLDDAFEYVTGGLCYIALTDTPLPPQGSRNIDDPYCDSGTVAVTADHRRATANHRRYLLLASQFLLRRPYAMSQRCEAALALALPCGCLLNKHVMSCCVFVIVSLSLFSQGAPSKLVSKNYYSKYY